MRRLVVSLVVLGLMGSPAFAEIDYDQAGKVVFIKPYDGPGVGLADGVALLTITGSIVAVMNVQEIAVQTIPPLAFLTWGAWRTSQLRPQAIKDQIHQHLAAQASQPTPGTVSELLQ